MTAVEWDWKACVFLCQGRAWKGGPTELARGSLLHSDAIFLCIHWLKILNYSRSGACLSSLGLSCSRISSCWQVVYHNICVA